MAKPCFQKKDSNPQLCGVHKVPLVLKHTSDTLSTSRFGQFTFLECPVSGHVVRDEPTESPDASA